jgi:RNA polymerase sigma-70 factor (ECF subfamily)
MRLSLSPSLLRELDRQVDHIARKLARAYRLPRHDYEDLRQDLITDLLARIKGFDPRRGSLGSLATTILRHRATRIAAQIYRHRRLFGPVPVSLDAPHPEADGVVRGELIPEDEGIAAIWGARCDPSLDIERRIDLERALSILDDRDRQLAEALSRESAGALAQHGFGSRSELYRRTGKIRLDLLAAGIGDG